MALSNHKGSAATNTDTSDAKMALNSFDKATTNAMTNDDNRAPLQDLPAELRNNILFFALTEIEAIDIKKGSWPGVLLTCKQLREEGLPVYLENNKFKAHVTDLDQSALTDWVVVVKGLPPPMRVLIKSVNVHCECKMLATGIGDARDEKLLLHLYSPRIAFWNQFTSDVSNSDLTPQELAFSSLCASAVQHRETFEDRFGVLCQLWVQWHVFVQPHLPAAQPRHDCLKILSVWQIFTTDRGLAQDVVHMACGVRQEWTLDWQASWLGL